MGTHFDVTLLDTLIFDVDGTLYDQTPVRRGMICRLLRAHLREPAQGFLTLRTLRAYRNAQEFLRTVNYSGKDIFEAQVELTSRWTGLQKDAVTSSVSRWMEREPLDLVARSTRKGVSEFLHAAKMCGFRLGVFSDYPATEKLAAMGLTHFFDVVVTARDPEVQRFKPDAQGIEVTLRRLGAKRERTLYIGDRPDIDIAAASRAGIPCIIIGQKRSKEKLKLCTEVSGYNELRDLVCRC